MSIPIFGLSIWVWVKNWMVFYIKEQASRWSPSLQPIFRFKPEHPAPPRRIARSFSEDVTPAGVGWCWPVAWDLQGDHVHVTMKMSKCLLFNGISWELFCLLHFLTHPSNWNLELFLFVWC